MADIGITRRDVARRDVVRGDGARREGVVERTGFRLSWGGIIAGFVVATSIQMVLSTLGIAVGLTAFDPGQGDSPTSLGIGVAVWFAITAIVSMLIGGMTTGRLAGILTPGDGRLHGVIMWGLSTLLAVYFASVGAGRLLGGAFDVLSRTTAAAGGLATTVGRVGAAAVDQGGGIDFDALQREIETTLRETGNPALQPENIEQQAEAARAQAATGASNQEVAREITDRLRQTAGQVNRQDLVNVVAARTGMSQAEAERAVTRIDSLATNARQQVSATAQNVRQEAGQVAGETANLLSRAAWATLLAMGLSLAAAVYGAGRTAPE